VIMTKRSNGRFNLNIESQ